MKDVIGVILAGGVGKRFQSALPKAFHTILEVPMAGYPIRAMKKAGVQKIFLVAPKGYEELAANIHPNIVVQEAVTGTAKALLTLTNTLRKFRGSLLVMNADLPLMQPDSLKEFLRAHQEKKAFASLMYTQMCNPEGYGRILVKNEKAEIKEESELSSEEKKEKKVNVGVYMFPCPEIFSYLKKIPPADSGEYYLPRVFHLFTQDRKKVELFELRDETEGTGVNTREDFSYVTDILALRIINHWQKQGVTFEVCGAICIGPDVELQQDCIIRSGTYILGKSSIEQGAVIGPHAYLKDCWIGKGTVVKFSYLEECRVGKGCVIGPFAHLRPKTVLGEDVRVGNFVEIKNSRLASGVRAAHLSYLGDAKIGQNANIGAGTITCNYDGMQKHRTEIEAGAFIGSNSTLIAPIKIGKQAYTAAGSTITRNVQNFALAISRSQQLNIPDWAKKRRKKPTSA